MADELLLQKSLQREKDEISRLQCQLQQQVSGSRSSSSSSRQTPQSNMTTATMASPNLKLGQQPNQWDLAEQQRRLLDLQSQQKHFQQQKHQQPTKHQQQPHFQLPTGQILHPADLGTAGHGIAALLSSPAMTTAAAAALAQLLSHGQQQQQALIINEAASFPKMPSPSHVPNSLASQSQLLTASHLDWRFLFSPMGTAAAHNIYNTGAKLPSDSPCPTPAYHYQLAAPKPSNRPLPIFQQQNFDITGNLSRTTVKPQAQTTQVGVDVRPADSTISTTTASAMALNDVTAGSIRKINRTDQSWEKNGHRETDKNIRNNESVSPPSKSSECQKQQNNNNNASGSDSTKSGESSPRSQQKRAVPVFQITPQQLHMLLQPFFRSQQNQQSAKADAMDCVQQSSAGNSVAATPAASRSSSIEDVAVVELTPSSPKKCRSGNNINDLMRKESIEDGEESEEYVDVVGDGGMARTSFLKVQRKAHIEFYRKLKSFRNRGNELDCQLCFTAVSNTDANVRSHIHGHCKTALFVCKLCQRGFQDQHLVFDHIGKEHPAHKGSPQFIEDRRDMAVLMELLAECFPRILCRARDCLFEAIGRLTAWAECQGHAQLQCRLCPASVPAQKNALYSHLNAHPSYRCKKCKFSCTDERGQLEHQRREHPGVAVAVESGALGLEKSPYCVSLAFDVLLLSLTRCFPLDKISASGLTGGHLANNEVKEEKDSKSTTVTKESMAEDGREKTKKKKRGTKKRKEQEKEEVVIEGSMKKASVVQEEPVKRRGRKRKSVQRQPKMVDGNSSADEEFGGKSQQQEAEDRTWTPQDD